MSPPPEHLHEPVLAHARKDFATLRSDLTIQQALDNIRRHGIGEKIVYFYVVAADDRLVGVVKTIEGCDLVSPKDGVLNNTLSFTVRGADGIALMAGLDLEGICASSGSACSAGSIEPSHVILAIGKNNLANSLVRFSLGLDSTAEEVDFVCAALPEIIRRTRIKNSNHG